MAHQLLAVSLGSPCRVDLEVPPPADGAVFALYNAARLQSLLDKFDAEVAAGTYPPLPPVAEIGPQFSRLSTEVRTAGRGLVFPNIYQKIIPNK